MKGVSLWRGAAAACMSLSALLGASAATAEVAEIEASCRVLRGHIANAAPTSVADARARIATTDQQFNARLDEAFSLDRRQRQLSQELVAAYPGWTQNYTACSRNRNALPACRERRPSRRTLDAYMAQQQELDRAKGRVLIEWSIQIAWSAAQLGGPIYFEALGDGENYNPLRDYNQVYQRQLERFNSLSSTDLFWYVSSQDRLGVRRGRDTFQFTHGFLIDDANRLFACMREAQIEANWSRAERAMSTAASRPGATAAMRGVSDVFFPNASDIRSNVNFSTERRTALEAPLRRAENEVRLAEQRRRDEATRRQREQTEARLAAQREERARQVRALGIRENVSSLPGGDLRGARSVIPCSSAAFPLVAGTRGHLENVNPGNQGSGSANSALALTEVYITVTEDRREVSRRSYYQTHRMNVQRYGDCDYLVRHERTIRNTPTQFGDGGGEIMRFHEMWNGAYVVARESLATGTTHFEIMYRRENYWQFHNLPCRGVGGLVNMFTGVRFQNGVCHADNITVLVTNQSLRTGDRFYPTSMWTR